MVGHADRVNCVAWLPSGEIAKNLHNLKLLLLLLLLAVAITTY